MAQFYAEIQGARGQASRLGTKASGLSASVKSWQGEVNIRMWTKADNDNVKDWVRVTLSPHSDSRSAQSVTLYEGPCDGWLEHSERGQLGRMMWNVEHGRKAA